MNASPGRVVVIAAALAALGMPANVSAQPTDALRLFDDPLHARQARADAAAASTCEPSQELPARGAPGQPLSLADAVDTALCNNPQLHEAWAAVDIQTAALGQARSAYLPTLQATVSRLRSSTTYPGNDVPTTVNNGTTLYANLSWRLFDFGGRATSIDVARLNLAAALASQDATVQATLNSVVESYFDAATARAALDARDAGVALSRSALESVQRRERGGTASQSDEFQATTALAKAALARSRAEGDLGKTLAALATVLGVAPGASVDIQPAADVDSDDTRSQTRGLEEWLAQARERHPALLAARAQLTSARKQVDAAVAEGLPTIDLTADRYKNGYPDQGLQPGRTRVDTIGIVLTIPLFDGFARTYKIHAAQAQAEQTAARLQDVQAGVLQDVAKAYADVRSSFDNLAYSRALLDAAQQSAQSSQRRYDRGAADVTELLTTRQALSDARQERAQCLSEWHSAKLRLMASAGSLDRMAAMAPP